MEVYIEKGFLDFFALKFDEDKNLSLSNQIVLKIFKEYGSTTHFIDFSIKDLMLNAERDYIIISKLLIEDHLPIYINNIKNHLFDKSKWKQVLVFTEKDEDWFFEAEKKGAICFSLDSYEDKINQFLEIVSFNEDLSKEFNSWGFLSVYSKLPFNNLIINDGYILVDSKHHKMDKNISPLIKTLLTRKAKNVINIRIYTKELLDLNRREERELNFSFEKKRKYLESLLEKKKRKLVSQLANFNCAISIQLIDNKTEFKFHDRIIYTNYSILECGDGFNLIPHKKSISQITSKTIFDKYTYDRMNNHFRMQDKLLKSTLSSY